MQSLLLLPVLLVFCLCFFTRLGKQQAQPPGALRVPPLPAEAPNHANGRAMTIREVHIWRSMQPAISAHWSEFSAACSAKYAPRGWSWPCHWHDGALLPQGEVPGARE